MIDVELVLGLMFTLPLVAAGLSLLLYNPLLLHGLNVAAMMALVVADVAVLGVTLEDGAFLALGDLIFVDALSVFILSIITVIGLACTVYMWTYFDEEAIQSRMAQRRLSPFFSLYHVFILTMMIATLANSLGIQWVAIEATTLTTVFLIAFFRQPTNLEAGWKYLILCSVGIALALFGVVLTYYSSIRVFGEENAALNLSSLIRAAGEMDGQVLKLAFIFIVVGYGTKIGLVPMHAWVPEAYSEAPAPVTAMLAGVLETVAMYAVLRHKGIVDHALSTDFTGNLLIAIGIISFGTAALFMLIQRDFKRLFAYSSIEHMGLAMVGFGAGGATGTFGGLFHLLNHALAKSLGFFAAGNVFNRYQSGQIRDVQGMAKVQLITAIAFVMGGLALVRMPPFSLFTSEILVLSSLADLTFVSDSFHLGQYLTVTISHEVRSLGIVALILVLGVVLFGGFLYRLLTMLWGTPPLTIQQGEPWTIGHVPLVVTMAALIWLGVLLPSSLEDLLRQATIAVIGK